MTLKLPVIVKNQFENNDEMENNQNNVDVLKEIRIMNRRIQEIEKQIRETVPKTVMQENNGNRINNNRNSNLNRNRFHGFNRNNNGYFNTNNGERPPQRRYRSQPQQNYFQHNHGLRRQNFHHFPYSFNHFRPNTNSFQNIYAPPATNTNNIPFHSHIHSNNYQSGFLQQSPYHQFVT